MDKKLYDLMNWPDIEGIIYSDGCNPKNLLGTHSVKGGILIQSFYPAAIGATVKAADGKTYEMEMADEEGYFAVLIPVKVNSHIRLSSVLRTVIHLRQMMRITILQ